LLAEFTGVFMIVFLGTASVGAMVWTGAVFGQWEISMAWGAAVALAICIAAPFSGAHLNPAVTIALWMLGRAPTRLLAPYLLAQFAGGFAGAMVSYLVYQPAIAHFLTERALLPDTPAILQAAGVFTTYAHSSLSWGHAFGVEFLITAILMIVVLVCGSSDRATRQGMPMALVVGLLVAVIGAATGPLTGFALNPARDFGPRVGLWLLGWGDIVMTGGHAWAYAWVPIVATTTGACAGALAYHWYIGRHTDTPIRV
jgi:glycerol uptake facilitator protein